MNKVSLLLSFLCFISIIISGLFALNSLISVDQKEQRLLLDEIVRAQAFAIERRLTHALSSAYILAQEIKQNGGQFHDFENYSKSILKTIDGISNLQLAPKGIIEKIYPLEGNEKALGHDLLNDKLRSYEARLAIKSRSLTLAGPYQLIQGGVGIIGLNPVFINENGKEYFWGFVSALMFLDELLVVTELEQLRHQGFGFHLSRINPDSLKMQMFFSSEKRLGQEVVSRQIKVPNGNWYLTMSRPEQQHASYFYMGISIIIIVAILFSILLYRILREPERLLSIVKEKTQALELIAFHDELTGLANRRYLKEQLQRMLANIKRHGGHFAMLYLDLDDYKQVNDGMGHESGDLLLKEVTMRIKDVVRENDLVARLGGDEFAVVLSDLKTSVQAKYIAEKIIHAIGQPVRLNEHQIIVGVSVGITLAPDDSMSFVELFLNADKAMYKSKSKGKNQCTFFNATMQDSVTIELVLEEQLREAVFHQEFEVEFQPVYSLKQSKVVMFEALLRWNHPEKGVLKPNQFLEIAEATSLILPITDWLIQKIGDFLKQRKSAGFDHVPVTINIDAKLLLDETFAKHLMKQLKRAEIETHLIEIEISESVLISHFDSVEFLINDLSQLGVQFIIDKFGSGYASINLLKKLPVKCIKIDKEFIIELEQNFNDLQIVEAMVAMAHKMGMDVIAIGIESNYQQNILTGIGCDFGQGNYFSPPLALSHAVQLAAEFKVSESGK